MQRTGRNFVLKVSAAAVAEATVAHPHQHMRLQVASNEGLEDATCTRIGIITTKVGGEMRRLPGLPSHPPLRKSSDERLTAT